MVSIKLAKPCIENAALEPLRNLQDFCLCQPHLENLRQGEVKASARVLSPVPYGPGLMLQLICFTTPRKYNSPC